MAAIAILGAGMMGSALAWPLADRGHDVRLIGTHLDDAIITELEQGRPHPGLGVAPPAKVRAYHHSALQLAAANAELFVLGVSSAGVRWAAQALGGSLRERARPLLMVAKGLENVSEGRAGGGLATLPDVLSQCLLEQGAGVFAPVAVAGPCIAGELARRVHTCVVLAGRDPAAAQHCAELVSAPYYQAEVAQDVVGVELCAALKNAYALGVGFAAGLHERAGGTPGRVALHNYEAAVFAQALREMQRLVTRLGGSAETALGLAGAGDLTVTCNGGRTGRFGKLLGSGLALPEAVAGMHGATLECLEILRVMDRFLAGEAGVARAELPLLQHLIEVALTGAPVGMPFRRFFKAP